jgi:sugar lactone lactonase YvrE/enterochelin esterase-like enzyme
MLMKLAATLVLSLAVLAPGRGAGVPGDASGAAAPDLVEKIRAELAGPPTADSKPNPGVPHGELIEGILSDSRIYPGTENAFKVYVPAQYSPARPACLIVRLDSLGADDPTVFDNLIAKGDMPVTIAVGISAGAIWKTRGKVANRWNRSVEFDSTNGNFPDFVLGELLPRVETLATKDGRPIHLSHEARDRAVMGISTGGIGSFTLAWERPDSFSRVYSMIGTFVAMRGGSDYPAIIRKTEPKPIRIFLEDGSTDAWNPLFGSWFLANENMEAALSFSGYDVQHAWGEHAHTGGPGNVILPDVMRWLWRGWPAPVQAGQSRNDMLASILIPGEGWEPVGDGDVAAASLASNPSGEVFFSDTESHDIRRIGADGKPAVFSKGVPPVGGLAFGPDGTLYATAPAEREVIAFDSGGAVRKVAGGIRGGRILVTGAGEIYVSEAGEHSDEPSEVWLIRPGGAKEVVDRGLLASSGIAFSPDKTLFFAAERTTKWIYSFVAQSDGTLQDKEAYYWLHMADISGESGAGELAADRQGNLYVATRLGVQVCDRSGRVRAILWLPTPCGPIQGLCWGGSGFDILYVTDGRKLFKRHMKVTGYPQWSAPIVLPPGTAA